MEEMVTSEAPPRFAGSAKVAVKSSFAPRATRPASETVKSRTLKV
jgi:hypothetical protein